MASTFWARVDSNNANNPALNLTGDPALQITFVPSGTNGDLLLEYASGSVDPDTQVSIDGVLYDFTFELSATMPTLSRDGAQQVPDQFEGSTTYVITVQDYPTAGETLRLAFMPDETATQAEMDAFGNGAIDLQGVDSTTNGAVCFAEGTMILTPRGEVPVEELEIGQMVMTLDDGPRPVLWRARSKFTWPAGGDRTLPIEIRAGALAPGCPSRDLVLSPQHKVLVPMAGAANGALAPARGLTDLSGVRRMSGKREIVYHHVLLPRHDILISNGAPTESFYPGAMALRALEASQRAALLALFPALRDGALAGYGRQARPALSVREARVAARSLAQRQKAGAAVPLPLNLSVA